MATKPKRLEEKPEGAKSPAHHLWRVYLIVGGAFLALAILVGGLLWFYSNRAMPNVTVGRVSVAQGTPDQIKQAVQQQSNFKVSFVNGKDSAVASLKDIGLSVDVNATVNKAMQARKSGNFWQNAAIWQTQVVPLVFVNDPGVLKLYIQQHFPNLFVDAKDSQLVYNSDTKQFDIQPGTQGKGFDIRKFEEQLPDLAANPRSVSLMVTSTPVDPIIKPSGLAPAQADINARLKLALNFTYNGRTVYTASPDDIATWAHFMPNASTGTVKLEFDQGAIKQFLDQQVASTVAQTPIDRKVVIDQQSGSQTILQAGRAGQEIQDTDKMSAEVLDAVTNNKPLDNELTVVTAPIKTITMTGSGKWIEVDLSKQTATMYVGDTPVDSFLISSGKSATPTEVGEFAIYRKLPLTTMTGTILGEYYYIPDIPWVSYFDGGEAFHGTYWHHNFGHPMSHGCINMSIPDAKVLYDFAPVGTKVYVHY